MQFLSWISILFIVASSSSCNTDADDKPSDEKITGSCSNFQWEGDPSRYLRQCAGYEVPREKIIGLKSGCEDAKGTWTEGENCAKENMVGLCTYGTVDFLKGQVSYVYYPNWPVESARAFCESKKGDILPAGQFSIK